MYKRYLLLSLLLLVVFFTACANKPYRLKQISISNQGEFTLQSPVDFGDNLSLLQEIEIQRGDEVLSMIAQVEIINTQVNIVALTPMGTRLFTIQWDDKEFHFSSISEDRLPFEPKRILADNQIILWPKLSKTAGIVVQESSKAPHFRDIYVDGKKIIHIQYDSDQRGKGNSTFHHMEQGYTIHTKTIQIESL